MFDTRTQYGLNAIIPMQSLQLQLYHCYELYIQILRSLTVVDQILTIDFCAMSVDANAMENNWTFGVDKTQKADQSLSVTIRLATRKLNGYLDENIRRPSVAK